MTYANLIVPPDVTHGITIGHGNWRLVVEALLAEDDDSVWGTATWNDGIGGGDAVWSELGWVDMTEYLRGLSWQRGSSQFGGRPDSGVLTLLVNTLDDAWSPLGDSPWVGYLGPGTMIRVAMIDSVTEEWVPQFCGVVESWPESFIQKDRIATVTVVETVSILAQLDENAGSTVGSGDDVRQRINRLLVDANWPYGTTYEGGVPEFFLSSTDMADNRLTELHLTADSGDCVFYNHRSGTALLRPADARLSSADINPIALVAVEPWNTRPGVSDYGRIVFHPSQSGESFGVDPFIVSNGNDYITVPDSAPISLTGDMTVIFELDYAGEGFTMNQGVAGSGTLSWSISVQPGIPGWWIVTQSENGTATTSVTLQGSFWKGWGLFAITVDANNGSSGYTCRLYRSFTNGGYWELLDTQTSTAVGTLSRFNSSAILELGKDSGSTDESSRFRLFELRDGIGTSGEPGGDVVLGIYPEDISSAASAAASSFTASTGQTVTVVNNGLTGTGAAIVYTTEEFTLTNDAEALINDVRLARAGGSQQTAIDDHSIGRFRFHSQYARSDLLTNTDAQVLTLANRILERRSQVSKRPSDVDVVARPGAAVHSNLPQLFKVDIGDPVQVVLPDGTTTQYGSIAAARHTLVPGGRGVTWSAVFSLDVYPDREMV